MQVLGHASSHLQAERAAAGKRNRMDVLGGIHGIEHVCLSGARSATTDIQPRNRSSFAQNDSAPCWAPWIGEVADLNAPYIRKSTARVNGTLHDRESFRLNCELFEMLRMAVSPCFQDRFDNNCSSAGPGPAAWGSPDDTILEFEPILRQTFGERSRPLCLRTFFCPLQRNKHAALA